MAHLSTPYLFARIRLDKLIKSKIEAPGSKLRGIRSLSWFTLWGSKGTKRRSSEIATA